MLKTKPLTQTEIEGFFLNECVFAVYGSRVQQQQQKQGSRVAPFVSDFEVENHTVGTIVDI